MPTRRHLLTLLLVLAAAVAASASAVPAGACAAAEDDPCLHDRETSFIRGAVFTDRAADGGERAATDTPRRSERVFLDLDGDAFADDGEPGMRTLEDGSFDFEVDPATFPDPDNPPALRVATSYGVVCTFPVPCSYRRAIVPGENLEGLDFGLITGAHLRGQANEDLNDNGVRDRDEPGAINLGLYIDVNHNKTRDLGEPSTGVPFHGAWTLEVPPSLLNQPLTLRSDNPRGFHCKAPRSCAEAVLPLGSGEWRDMGQRMISEPIVIFVHGFLGSEIGCPGNLAWFDGLGADLLDMQIAEDGRSNMTVRQGGTACSERARPTGRLIEEAAGKDIYGATVRHYSQLTRAERYASLAWDWRKDPESQVHVLDQKIDELRCEGFPPCEHPRHDKVVLVAHSQGGLLSRAYISDPTRAAKVRRLVTVGTPTWGSPKSIFPLVAGIETPIGGPGMDIFLDNDDLKVLYRNLAGAFALLPSPAYGSWLSVPTFDTAMMDADSVPAFARAVGGNELLIRQQGSAHSRIYDHYANLNGVDYQVVAGKGVATITQVGLVYGAEERVVATFGDGDQTVPLTSAAFDAPADRLHYVCGISHVPLTADEQTTAMVDDFVAMGEPVKPNPRGNTDCALDATVVNVYGASTLGFDLTDPVGTAARSRPRARRTPLVRAAQTGGKAIPLAQAQADGLVDVIQTATQTLIVVDNHAPVDIELPPGRGDAPYTVTTQDLDGGKRGPVQAYAARRGKTTIATGAQTRVMTGATRLRPSKRADLAPPRTRAAVTRLRGGRVRVTLKARDRSTVKATYLFVGERRRRYRTPVVLSARDARRATFASVDRWGNSEARRPLRVR